MVTITFINCFKIPKSSAVVVRFAFKSLDLVLCISMIISTTACLMEVKLAFLRSRTNRKCFVVCQGGARKAESESESLEEMDICGSWREKARRNKCFFFVLETLLSDLTLNWPKMGRIFFLCVSIKNARFKQLGLNQHSEWETSVATWLV